MKSSCVTYFGKVLFCSFGGGGWRNNKTWHHQSNVKVPGFQVPTGHRPAVAPLPPKRAAPAARLAAWRGSATLRVLQGCWKVSLITSDQWSPKPWLHIFLVFQCVCMISCGDLPEEQWRIWNDFWFFEHPAAHGLCLKQLVLRAEKQECNELGHALCWRFVKRCEKYPPRIRPIKQQSLYMIFRLNEVWCYFSGLMNEIGGESTETKLIVAMSRTNLLIPILRITSSLSMCFHHLTCSSHMTQQISIIFTFNHGFFFASFSNLSKRCCRTRSVDSTWWNLPVHHPMVHGRVNVGRSWCFGMWFNPPLWGSGNA